MIQLNCGSTWHPSFGQQHGEAALRPEHIGLGPTPGTHAAGAHDDEGEDEGDEDDGDDASGDADAGLDEDSESGLGFGLDLDSDAEAEADAADEADEEVDAEDEAAGLAAGESATRLISAALLEAAAHVFAVGVPVGHGHSCPAAFSSAYDGAQSLVRVRSQPSGMPGAAVR